MTIARYPSVLFEMIVYRQFPKVLGALFQGNRLFNVLEPVIDAPEIESSVLTQVANNDLQIRFAIEHAICDQANKLQIDIFTKTEWRANEKLAVNIELLVDNVCGRLRVGVERNIGFLADLTVYIVLGCRRTGASRHWAPHAGRCMLVQH